MSAVQPRSLAVPSDAYSTDRLLQVTAVALVVLGSAWFLLSRPWDGSDEHAPLDPVDTAATTAPAPQSAFDEPGEPIEIARVAAAAGMLIDAGKASAWSLYLLALERDPDDAEAVAGLNEVAGLLVERAQTATDQARLVAANDLLKRVLAVLPDHPSARMLQRRIENELQVEVEQPVLFETQAALELRIDKPLLNRQAAKSAVARLKAPSLSRPSAAKAKPVPSELLTTKRLFETALSEDRLLGACRS